MALLSDNSDIQIAYFRITTGNDGDFYPEVIFKDSEGLNRTACIRIAMSGGNAPTDVKLAMAELYRALEKHKLNEHTLNEPERWPYAL